MRAIISLNEPFLQNLCGTDRRRRTAQQESRVAHSRAAAPTPRQYLRYWLKYWGVVLGKSSSMKEPRTMPAVVSPAPATCMCCWYQQHYNPVRPADALGRCRYAYLRLVVRAFPPMKPDEINEICGPHIELLYPPRGTKKGSPTLVAVDAAHVAGVSA